MSANTKDKNEPKEIPIGIKWEWDDTKKCLTYKNNTNQSEKNEKKKKIKDSKIDLRSGVPRLVTQNRQNLETKSEPKRPLNAVVTINDVKNAALSMLSERYYIPIEFENYCNDKNSKAVFEDFLLNLANYFYWFFESIDSRVLKNPMCIEKSLDEKKRIEHAELMIKKTLKSLARRYCMLILGLGSEEYHHMNAGKSRNSSGFKDRGLYETLYPFCIFFVWITFKRRDHELIRNEIGRVLRSESFNSPIKVETILEEENRRPESQLKSKNKQTILNKYQEHKTIINEFQTKIQQKSSGITLGQRSPALVSILPRPEENSKWLFDRKSNGLKNFKDKKTKEEAEEGEEEDAEQVELIHELGIIGLPLKLFHIKTLAARGNNDEDNDHKTNEEQHHENVTKIENESENNEKTQ